MGSGGTVKADLPKQVCGDVVGQFQAAGARAGAPDQVAVAELAEHLAVSGRGQIDRQLGRQLAQRRFAGLERGGDPYRQARRGAADLAASPSMMARTWATRWGGTRLRTTSSACRAATRVIDGSESPDRNAGLGPRPAQPEAVTAHLAAVVIAALAGEKGAQAFDRLPHARRGVRPLAVVPAGHNHGAGGAERDIDRRPGQRCDRADAERKGDRAAHTDRQRSESQRQAGRAMTDRGGQREGVVGHHLANPQGVQPDIADRSRDVEGFLVGPIQPKRQNSLDPCVAHSVVASARWPSRIRPGSSRDASLTWKWAVAVNASRSRRCNGEVS